MEPHRQSPWYLHENTLVRQGSGGLSASSEIRRSSTALRQSLIRARLTHSSRGKARACASNWASLRRFDLLRRQINEQSPYAVNLGGLYTDSFLLGQTGRYESGLIDLLLSCPLFRLLIRCFSFTGEVLGTALSRKPCTCTFRKIS
jgi:hypothetical protein